MKASIDYSEISKLIKQSTDVDVDIKFVKREHYPIQVSATVDLPIIGTHTIKVDVTLRYKEKHLFVFYDLGFLYKAMLPKVVKYITDKEIQNTAVRICQSFLPTAVFVASICTIVYIVLCISLYNF